VAPGDDVARAVFDPEAFERQTGGDADLRAEIIQMFLEDCPVRVEEIHAAVAGADATALVSSAHALKGSAAYLSASIVRGRAADLERLGRERRLAEAPAMLDQLDAAVTDLLALLHNLPRTP
jgi:two-component system sensor histidine kinase/response regulator